MLKFKVLYISVFILTIFAALFLYRDSLTGYFFQDDWFTLKISNIRNLADFIGFFIPRQDVIYYRPLGMQIPFFLSQKLFGLDPNPFKIVTMITHIINSFLVYFLVFLLLKKPIASFLTSFLYATSAIHYTIFYWSATYSFMLASSFIFLTIIFFIHFLRKNSPLFYFLSLFLFLLSLLTNELIAVLPLILSLYLFFIKQKKFLLHLWPFFFMGVFLFVFRFIFFIPPLSGYYQLAISRDLFINLRDYIFWSFSWPEEMKGQFIKFLQINPLFIKNFQNYYLIFIGSFIVNIVLLFLCPLVFIWHKNQKIQSKFIIFAFGWFFLGLLPVIFFKNHTFSYYLSFSILGLLLVSASLIDSMLELLPHKMKLIKVSYLILVLSNWYFISATTIEFNSKVHWAPRRSKLSAKLIQSASRLNPANLSNMTISAPDDSETKLALNDQDAMQVFFNKEDIFTLFSNDIESDFRL